jgi:hypothetical protein
LQEIRQTQEKQLTELDQELQRELQELQAAHQRAEAPPSPSPSKQQLTTSSNSANGEQSIIEGGGDVPKKSKKKTGGTLKSRVAPPELSGARNVKEARTVREKRSATTTSNILDQKLFRVNEAEDVRRSRRESDI